MAEGAPIKVLVVDDEPLAVERLQLLLARAEGVILVGTANDGEGALRIAEIRSAAQKCTIVGVPNASNVAVLRRLRSSVVSAITTNCSPVSAAPDEPTIT